MANSATKTLADLVVTAINAWAPSSPPWPSFTASFRWVPAHQLESLTNLVVNVAPAALSGNPTTRKHLDRERDIAIQFAHKLSADAATAVTQTDNLLALVEQLDAHMFSSANRVLASTFMLSKTTVSSFDWDLALTKRVFHAVDILTYKSLES